VLNRVERESDGDGSRTAADIRAVSAAMPQRTELNLIETG
jgi:hypothetical protein